MTENDQAVVEECNLDSWFHKDRKFQALRNSVRPANKDTLFDALATAGITAIIVQFDGAGDSGQIEDIETQTHDRPVELPVCDIEIAQASWGSAETERRTLPIRDVIESLVYELLEETHDGWEINDGAYGTVTFDVTDRTISLAYNERHTETDYSEHVF